jgi:hypothetical protein
LKFLKAFRSKPAAAVPTVAKSLCLRTVDEELCDELAARCKRVTQVHKTLKGVAMDRPLLKNFVE